MLKAGDDCPDTTLAAKGITNQPNYVIGDQPKFTMVVTNIGLVECKRDVGAAVLAAYVYSLDNNRLWSNLDCAPSNETLVIAGVLGLIGAVCVAAAAWNLYVRWSKPD